jgi:hypothetical protein
MFGHRTISPRGELLQFLGIQGWRVALDILKKRDPTEELEILLGAFLIAQQVTEQ